MEFNTIVSEKGKVLLVVNGFKFSKKKVLKSGESFWTCTVKTCNSKIFTLGEELLISRKDDSHNHLNDNKKLNRQIISGGVKRKAEEDISARPSKLIHRMLKENKGKSSILF